MQQTAEPAPQPPTPSFVGLLAALTAPASPAANRTPAWNDDGLDDDVATLSYERALRANARYKYVEPSDLEDCSPTKSGNAEPILGEQVLQPGAPPAWPEAIPPKLHQSSADSRPKVSAGLPIALESNLKSASVTIRLSKAESAQLRQRAADAGLTISAYLRSCTFEAESLRALVKDTMAQLRPVPSGSNTTAPDRTAVNTPGRSWFGRLLGLLPRLYPSRRIARA